MSEYGDIDSRYYVVYRITGKRIGKMYKCIYTALIECVYQNKMVMKYDYRKNIDKLNWDLKRFKSFQKKSVFYKKEVK